MEIRHIVILNYDICFTLNGAKLAYISIDIINFQQSFDEKYWWIHAEITKIWRLVSPYKKNLIFLSSII